MVGGVRPRVSTVRWEWTAVNVAGFWRSVVKSVATTSFPGYFSYFGKFQWREIVPSPLKNQIQRCWTFSRRACDGLPGLFEKAEREV